MYNRIGTGPEWLERMAGLIGKSAPEYPVRWCYGGIHFSEDLDFVTPLAMDKVRELVNKTIQGAEKVMIPHFGLGTTAIVEKKSRHENSCCPLKP